MQEIVLNEKGIRIHGAYKMLLASSLFYFRIPRENWEARMRLLKTAGYNAIDVYFPWNFHETAPGQWDFTGQKDVEVFLEFAAKNKLFVIARPGPYICSEWDGGALPAWLSARNVDVRQDDATFLKEVDAWYAHILPIVAKYQINKSGTVICMQIENELDFFQCKSPVSYMEKLKTMAESYGIEMPLFYCCGQNDLLRGGGLTPELYTAFNVYSSAETEGLEERALQLYESVQERKMPFLVTETNREHSYLKRLIACGAKLLSPYNQTASSTIDWYNGITNWGTKENPIALMASDYDFKSMIGAAGEVNEQFYEARLLAGLLHSFGERLAQARPVVLEEVLEEMDDTSRSLHVLKLESEDAKSMQHLERRNIGYFVEVNNLTRVEAVKTVWFGDECFNVQINSLETKLLPYKIQISEGICLYGSNYEIAYVEKQEGMTIVALYGDGALKVVLEENGEYQVFKKQDIQGLHTFTLCGISVLAGTKEEIASGYIPGLPDMKRGLDEQYEEGMIDIVKLEPYTWQKTEGHSVKLDAMEKIGQFRGIGSYEVKFSEDCDILLHQVADIVTVKKDGVFQEIFYGNGGVIERTLTAGAYEFMTEIWGHSNFDAVRCPSLKMGSLKGIRKITQVTKREDITDNWLFDLDEQPIEEWYFFRHSNYNTIAGIDSYNRATTPLRGTYDKWVEIDDKADSLVLHFSEADCLIWVYVNNHYAGCVSKADPYVDISAYVGTKRIEICLRTMRRYYSDAVGKVTLISGKQVLECTYSKVTVTGATVSEQAKATSLPLHMEEGECKVLIPKIADHTSGDVKLFLTGADMKFTVIMNGHVVGRIVLDNDSFPVVAGGGSDTVTICGSWLKEGNNPIMICQAIGKNATLLPINMRTYHSVC